jgi:uncharacterized glyoxalase superfamily protein PhnB
VISAIHLTTVFVSDQEKALDFDVNTLGFQKTQDAAFGEGQRFLVVVPPGAVTGLALTLPSDMGLGAGVIGRYTGISMLAKDIMATYEELSKRGVAFQQPPERMPWGSLATWFSDPHGNGYFLAEPE